MSLEDAVRLVRARGKAMQDAVPAGTGAMAAVMSVEPARLEALCAEAAQGEVVSAANFNAPGQIVSPATPAPSRARASSARARRGRRSR